jgi:Ser/Thr protein kinase RdoA (MazF antagonist)
MGHSQPGGCGVTQHAVEVAIGKLATDAEFRARFFADPAVAAWEAGLPLSPGELEALSALSHRALLRFSQSLDPRIIRLALDGPTPPGRACSGNPDSGRESTT